MIFRVPFLNDQQSSKSNYNTLEYVRKFQIFSFSRILRIRFPFGFSSRMLFLIWCVFGGFLLHFFESVFLDILLKTNYEKPVDTAEDVRDRNLTVVKGPNTGSMLKMLKNSPSAVIRELAEMTIVPKVIFLLTSFP